MKTETIAIGNLVDEGCDFKNPRQIVDRTAIRELAASIDKEGLLYPLQVWRMKEGKKTINIVIDGRRRLWAISELVDIYKKRRKSFPLAKNIPCVIVNAETLSDARILALTGNIQRKDLTSYEIAQEMLALKEAGMKGKDIAAQIGKSGAWVSRQLSAFTKSSDLVRKAWRQGVVPDETVQELAKLSCVTGNGTPRPDHQQQNARLEKILKLRTQEDTPVAGAKATKATKAKPTKAKNAAAARNVARTGSERVVKPSTDNLRKLITTIGKPKKTDRYLQGVIDATRFSMGELGYGEFGKELQDLVQAQLKAATPKEK